MERNHALSMENTQSPHNQFTQYMTVKTVVNSNVLKTALFHNIRLMGARCQPRTHGSKPQPRPNRLLTSGPATQSVESNSSRSPRIGSPPVQCAYYVIHMDAPPMRTDKKFSGLILRNSRLTVPLVRCRVRSPLFIVKLNSKDAMKCSFSAIFYMPSTPLQPTIANSCLIHPFNGLFRYVMHHVLHVMVLKIKSRRRGRR